MKAEIPPDSRRGDVIDAFLASQGVTVRDGVTSETVRIRTEFVGGRLRETITIPSDAAGPALILWSRPGEDEAGRVVFRFEDAALSPAPGGVPVKEFIPPEAEDDPPLPPPDPRKVALGLVLAVAFVVAALVLAVHWIEGRP